MLDNYTVPPLTRIGHIHLRVPDLQRSIGFYKDILGFEVTMMYGTQAAFLSAGGYHHHIGLNTWHSRGQAPVPMNSIGLYYAAILYPTRNDLANIFKRPVEVNYPIEGASDHGVSEAIYLSDPDGNGLELYWDRPKEEWPLDSNGRLTMFTNDLDLHGLLALAD
ncbi:MAG: VOC family protein [Sphingobacteriales bacterium]|jgi:catechol 2,3-dioxygenase|nr:VOC family protein [Sphingobacteriales bacterium]